MKAEPIYRLMRVLFCFPLLVAAFLAGGCQNPEVVQMSPGVYQLARADHGGIFGNKDALRAGVIRDANVFAEKEGKVAVPLSAKEHPVGIMGDWASYEYTFKVVTKDSPEARTPTALVRSDSVRVGGATSLGSKDTFYVAKPIETAEGLSASTMPAQASPKSDKSTGDRLLELKKLFDAGAITKEEYDAKKKVLLEKL